MCKLGQSCFSLLSAQARGAVVQPLLLKSPETHFVHVRAMIADIHENMRERPLVRSLNDKQMYPPDGVAHVPRSNAAHSICKSSTTKKKRGQDTSMPMQELVSLSVQARSTQMLPQNLHPKTCTTITYI